MHYRSDNSSRRSFSLGLVASPITTASWSGVFAPDAIVDEQAASPKWLADRNAHPFGLTETFHRKVLALPIAPFDLREVDAALLAKIKPAGAPVTFLLESAGQTVTQKPLHQSLERFAVYWKTRESFALARRKTK